MREMDNVTVLVLFTLENITNNFPLGYTHASYKYTHIIVTSMFSLCRHLIIIHLLTREFWISDFGLRIQQMLSRMLLRSLEVFFIFFLEFSIEFWGIMYWFEPDEQPKNMIDKRLKKTYTYTNTHVRILLYKHLLL